MTSFYNISHDNTLGGNNASHKAVSSQKAVKEYVDSHVSGVNDGTNWTSLSINGVTKAIPQGGGGSSNIEIITLNYSIPTYSLPSGITFASIKTLILNGKHIVLRVQTDDVVDKWEYYNLSFIAGNNIQEAEQQGLYFYSLQYNYLYELRVNPDNTITANYYPIGGGTYTGYNIVRLEEAEEPDEDNTWYNDSGNIIINIVFTNTNDKNYYIMEIPNSAVATGIELRINHTVVSYSGNNNKNCHYLLMVNKSNYDLDIFVDDYIQDSDATGWCDMMGPQVSPVLSKYNSSTGVIPARELSFLRDSSYIDFIGNTIGCCHWTISQEMQYSYGGRY